MDGVERITFISTGGDSLGTIEASILHELVVSSIVPDMVVGASAGAINAAFSACNPHVADTTQLEALQRGVRRAGVMPWLWRAMFSMLGILGRRRRHLVDASSLRYLLTRYFAQTLLKATTLPLHVVATNIHTGAGVVLSSDAIMPAALASAAIPGVFPPMHVGDHLLTDDGVANNAPIFVTIRLGVTCVVMLSAGLTRADCHAPRSTVEHAPSALSPLVAYRFVQDLERWTEQVPIAVVPPLCPLDVSPHDYAHCNELIDRAATITTAWFMADNLAGTGILNTLCAYNRNEDHPNHSANLHDIPTA